MTSQAISLPVTLFALVVVIFFGLRFWKITSFSIWGGEAFTMIGIKQDWSGMFAYVIADIVHPPLFYILLKLWVTLGGESLLWLKLFPGLSSIALIVPFYLLCRELGFKWTEMSLALFLAAVNGYLIHYAQELRMYSLFTFLAMCSFWLFIRFFNSIYKTSGELLLLMLVNLLVIYTHYYGWVVVGMEFLFLLIWQRGKVLAFGLGVVVLLLAFSPWAYLVIREVQSIGGLDRNLDWIPKPELFDILDFYSSLNGPLGSRYLKSVGLLLFGLPVLLWFWKIVRSDFRSRSNEFISYSWLVLLSFLPVNIIFLISQKLAQAVWIDRYFIFIAVPYLMLVSAAAYRLKPEWMRHTWIVLIVLWGLVAGLNDLMTNRMAWGSPQLGSRVRWDDLARQMIAAENDSPEPIHVYTLTVITNGLRTGDWASSTSLDYFLDSYGEEKFQFVYARDVKALLDRPPQENHFWIAFFEVAQGPQASPALTLKANGYRTGDPIIFGSLHNRVVLLPVWRK
jgi:4-amino-4-deoxy-L-arabinose transferase-like glycosyltransferase